MGVRWLKGNRMRLTLAIVSFLLLILTGCATTSHSASEPRGNAERVTSAHCGIERWPVKTGTDPSATVVNNNVTDTTVGNLTSIPAPAGPLPQTDRISPVETSTYRVVATLVRYKIEADQDIHMVLNDNGSQMIAELPDPQCATGSLWLSQIASARSQFESQFHPSTSWQVANTQITIIGIGFFDSIHGQTGVAPNGIEIHPVLSYEAIG